MKTTGYCYQSVNVITLGLAQSDHIKRLLLYLNPCQTDIYSNKFNSNTKNGLKKFFFHETGPMLESILPNSILSLFSNFCY